MDKIENEN